MKIQKPNIYINNSYIEAGTVISKEIFEETDKYSITPRTFYSRNLASENATHYIDKYQYLNHEVTRYGINSISLSVDLEKNLILGEKEEIIKREDQSLSSVKSNKYTPQDAKKVILHPLEVDLINQAITHLLEPDRRTVLVDIFARENGAVKLLENNHPEIHTTVLYKNPLIYGKQEILVIDPSNFLFSSHLSNLNEKLKHNVSIATLHKALQIYKPVSNEVGSGQDQCRDCIDIAVKVAFGFNEMKTWLPIELAKIGTYDVIKAISNQPALDRAIIDNNLVARIKQTSDVKIVKAFYEVEKIIDKNLKMVSRDMVETTKDKYKNILSNTQLEHALDTNSLPNNNVSTIQKLIKLNEEFITELSTQLSNEQEQLNLIGLGLEETQ